MIFKQWEQVLNRRKTQSRRLVKEGEFTVNQHDRTIPDSVWGNGIDTVYDGNGRCKWQVGQTYAVQPGRGKKAVGRVLLTGLRGEWLQDITGLDATGEGFQPIQRVAPGIILIPDLKIAENIAIRMFAEYWDSLHKPKNRWHRNPGVWALEFELVEGKDV